jgi:hypothetical protein
MRTTIDIDGELLEKARERAAQEGRSVDEFLAAAVQVAVDKEPPKERPFPTFHGKLRPGLNLDKTWELIEQVEGPFAGP